MLKYKVLIYMIVWVCHAPLTNLSFLLLLILDHFETHILPLLDLPNTIHLASQLSVFTPAFPPPCYFDLDRFGMRRSETASPMAP